MQVLVFKTNLNNTRQVHHLEPLLNVHPHIRQWNVDLEDCDKILRIESENLKERDVEQMVSGIGYWCEAL